MKKRVLALGLAFIMCLAGCGGKDTKTAQEGSVSGGTAQETLTADAGTEETTPTTDETTPATGTEETSMPVKELTMLKAVGKNVYDENGEGELVQLRGVNVGGWLFQEFWMTPTDSSSHIYAELDIYNYLMETYGEETLDEIIATYQDAYFTEEDFDRCQEMGMNCLRLPFWYLNIVDMEGNLREDWYERFDWFIENAKERGMYVILDFHGAPGSQNGSDHSGVDGGSNKMGASQFFFGSNNKANQELFYQIWEAIATRYKDEPAVAGYDLLNEPFCTYRYNMPISDAAIHEELWRIYDEAYDRIRAIDPEHIVIMEATWDPVDLPNPADYEWTNVMYQYHNYLYDDYDNLAGKQISNMENKVNLIKVANYDVPSLMGEFNYMNSFEAWEEGLALLNDEGLHWTMWTYKTTSGNWGLVNQAIGEIRLESKSAEEIIEFYKKVGECYENTALIEVVSEALKKEDVPMN